MEEELNTEEYASELVQFERTGEAYEQLVIKVAKEMKNPAIKAYLTNLEEKGCTIIY